LAIEVGKKFKVKYFALSFANRLKDVKLFRKLIGKKSFLISKIETKKAYKNIKEITKSSNAILIDRGDLSRYYPIDSIPIIQKLIINEAKLLKTECYIATNLLESMIVNFYPTRAESNDIFSCLELGAKGLVLAAETAIGEYPKECVSFVKKCIIRRDNFLKSGKF
jgi:pyruvate kinase